VIHLKYLKRNLLLTDDLTTHYAIKYPDPLQAPIQFVIEPHSIKIRCYIKYTPELLEPYELYSHKRLEGFKSVESYIPDDYLQTKDLYYTYADAIEEAIKLFWEGEYSFSWYSHNKSDKLPVSIEFIRLNDPTASFNPVQHFARIYFASKISVSSSVKSSLHRRFWGFFRNHSFEGIELNWAVSHPGSMYLKRCKQLEAFQRVVAHEFGHMLGIGDAYGASYRLFYQADGTSNFMMCHGHQVQPQEIEMALRAHQTNKLQSFPIKFSIKAIMQTLRRKFA